MRTFALAATLSMIFCAGLGAGPKKRAWMDAHVLKIGKLEDEYTTVKWRSDQPIGVSGTLTPDGFEKHHRTLWNYYFKSADKVYSGNVEKKALPGIEEGDQVKIFQRKDILYVLPADGKERKLDFLRITTPLQNPKGERP